VAQLEQQLHLNDPVPEQYWRWFSGVLKGDPGTSLTNSRPVSELVGPHLKNSAVLIFLAALIGTALGVSLGVYSAARRDGWLDSGVSLFALVVSAVPEFVVGITLVILFSTVVFNWLPAVSVFAPEASPWDNPKLLVLPVATLVIVIFPYIFRMTRAATLEALQSEYVEMAELKGIGRRRVLFLHALLNAVPAVVQVIGLNLLYLAGGIVVVEYVFNYPGLGQTLVAAVSTRDIPVIQFTVLLLAAFYVLVNIAADILTLLATPRRRLPRSG
jgi:peptide/nickel transport system permease protein